MTTADQSWRIRDADVTWRAIDDQVVVLNLTTSQYLTLNGTAGELWRLLVPGATESMLASYLVTKYELESAVATVDVAVFLDECRQHEVIETVV
jgi:hypothetical protein